MHPWGKDKQKTRQYSNNEEYQGGNQRGNIQTKKITKEETKEAIYEEPTTFLHQLNNARSLTAVAGDTIYPSREMTQPDRKEFLKVWWRRYLPIIRANTNANWEGTEANHSTSICMGHKKRKRKIGTGEVSKYKARLNANGVQQEYGIDWWKNFAPVVQSTRISLLMSLAKMGWNKQAGCGINIYTYDCWSKDINITGSSMSLLQGKHAIWGVFIWMHSSGKRRKYVKGGK